MTHGTDRRIVAEVYIGMTLSRPRCGRGGSVFEIHRKNPSGPWRLKRYRVLHKDEPYNFCNGGPAGSCDVAKKDEYQLFDGVHTQMGGGWMKRSMIEHGETSLEDAWRRVVGPVLRAGPMLDEPRFRKDMMPRGYR